MLQIVFLVSQPVIVNSVVVYFVILRVKVVWSNKNFFQSLRGTGASNGLCIISFAKLFSIRFQTLFVFSKHYGCTFGFTRHEEIYITLFKQQAEPLDLEVSIPQREFLKTSFCVFSAVNLVQVQLNILQILTMISLYNIYNIVSFTEKKPHFYNTTNYIHKMMCIF